MSDGSQKACCKYCGMLLAKESNTSLKKHITKPFCKALKNDPKSQQTQISNDGGIFHYNVDEVRDRMAKFVIQEALSFGHFDNPRLTNMIRDTLQSRYSHPLPTTAVADPPPVQTTVTIHFAPPHSSSIDLSPQPLSSSPVSLLPDLFFSILSNFDL
ncbi:hypothetical protein R6Q57_006015 [Mikania cordata]